MYSTLVLQLGTAWVDNAQLQHEGQTYTRLLLPTALPHPHNLPLSLTHPPSPRLCRCSSTAVQRVREHTMHSTGCCLHPSSTHTALTRCGDSLLSLTPPLDTHRHAHTDTHAKETKPQPTCVAAAPLVSSVSVVAAGCATTDTTPAGSHHQPAPGGVCGVCIYRGWVFGGSR